VRACAVRADWDHNLPGFSIASGDDDSGIAGVSSEAAHANIVSAPEDKPWKLREFTVADLDGFIRVFYDFSRGA
jgi:hypothetical protein